MKDKLSKVVITNEIHFLNLTLFSLSTPKYSEAKMSSCSVFLFKVPLEVERMSMNESVCVYVDLCVSTTQVLSRHAQISS